MADIIITPGSSIMSFTSSLNYTQTLAQEASGSLTLQGSGSTGRTDLFTVNGNNGTLFSVSDDLSDSLFSVNTIAGLPVIEAFANNTVVMGQYGQNVLVVTGSRVGIGTTSPYSLLQVGNPEQTTPAELTIASRYDGGGPILNFRTDHPNNNNQWNMARIVATDDGNYNGRIEFRTTDSSGYTGVQPTTKMVIKASGNVGIGTTSPSQKLDVVGEGRFGTGAKATIGTDGSYGGYSTIGFGGTSNGSNRIFAAADGLDGLYIAAATSRGISFRVNGGTTDNMYINSSGNVGIGNTSPNKQLTFAQATDDAIQIRRLTTSQGSPAAGTGISWTWSDSSTNNETWAAIRVIMPGSGNSNMTFSTTPGSGASGLAERMRITDGGNVGIGTTSPAAKLTVVGDGSGVASIGSAGFGSNYTAISLNGTLSTNNYNLLSSPSDNNLYINRPSGNDIYFRMANNDQVTIKSSGNVGIGTDSPASLLHISGTGSTFTRYTNTSNSGHYVDVGANNAGQSFVYSYGAYPLLFGTNGSTRMTISNAGALRLHAYGSGTNTGTTAYTLAVDSSGNIIETTSGGGTIDGSGTANYIPRWSDSNTLTNSLLYDTGAQIGLGTTAPLTKLDINGSIRYANKVYYYDVALVGTSGTAKWTLKSANGSEVSTLSTNYVYRIQLVTAGTGTNTGETWLAQNVDAAGWTVKRVYSSIETPNSNYPYMIVDSDGLPKVTSSHPSNYNTIISVEEFNGGNNGTTTGVFGLDCLITGVGNNVGIGITSPTTTLDVAGTFHVSGDATFNGTNTYINSSNIVVGNNSTDVIGVSGNTMYFPGNGKVGIGNTSPGATLTVGTQSSGTAGSGVAQDNSIIGRFGAANTAARVVGLTVANTATSTVGNDSTLSFIVAGNYSATGLISTILQNTSTAASDMAFSVYSNSMQERMRIQGSTGNVGIGTTNPGYKLDLVAASTSDGIRISQGGSVRFIFNGDGVAYWGPTANVGQLTWDTGKAIVMGQSGAALSLGSNGTYDRLFINTSGDVGIGTTSPSYKLDVNGTGKFTSNVGIGTTPSTDMLIVNGGSVFSANLSTLGESYNLASSARGSIYEVAGTVVRIAAQNNSVNSAALINFNAYNSSNGATGAFIGAAAGPTGNNAANLVFGRRTGTTSWDETMRISSTGNVGIGSTSPTATLDINAQRGTATNLASSKTAAGFDLNSNTTGGTNSLTIGETDQTSYFLQHANGAGTTAYNLALNPYGGNVGIGTSNPSVRLHVVSPDLGSTAGNTSYNALFYNSTGNQSFLEVKDVRTSNGSDWTSVGKRLQMRVDSTYMGYMQFNGTGNNYGISFGSGATTTAPGNVAERMRITTDGNIGIGITNPSYKFHVYDTTNDARIFIQGTSNFALFQAQNSSTGAFYLGIDNSSGSGFSQGVYSRVLYSSGAYPLVISTNGVARMTISSAGALRLHAYGSGTNTGTVAYNLAVDSSGNVIETAGGVVDGSGTANYISKWQDANTLTNSVMYDDGTNVGIGTTSPEGKLQVGSSGLVIDQLNDLVAGSASSRIFTTSGLAGGIRPAQGSHLVLQTRSTASRDIIFATGTTPTERMTIKGGGNVGIGTASPGAKLELQDTANSSTLLITADGANEQLKIRRYSNTNEQLIFGFASSDYGYVQAVEQGVAYRAFAINPNGGNVGIGTTNPGQKLEVDGALKLTSNPSVTADTSAAYFWNQGGVGPTVGGLKFQVQTNGSTAAMTIDESQRVGIGTTSPSTKLQISDTTSPIITLERLDGTVTDNELIGQINFKSTDTNDTNPNAYIKGIREVSAVSQVPMALTFGTGVLGTVDERLRITSTGNVGIGTSIPLLTDTGRGNLTINGSSASILTLGVNGSWSAYLFTNSTGTYIQGSNQLIFETNGVSNRLVITSAGNVGIGTSSPNAKLELAASGEFIRLNDSSATGNPFISFFQLNTRRSYIQHVDSGDNLTLASEYGGIALLTGTGGTETEKMRITSAGDVGIGSTNPVSKLHVVGEGDTVTLQKSNNIPAIAFLGTSTNKSVIEGGDNFNFYTLGSSRIYISGSGNVGIGTTSPSQKLHVNGRTLVNQFQYTKAINYSSGDLNSLTTAGFYDGSGMSNAPNSGWFWVTVETYSGGDDNWIHQTATSLGSLNTANEVYTRVRSGGSWGAWKQLGDSASISGTTNYVSKFTSGTAIGNSQIFDNGTNVGIGTTGPGYKLEVIGTTGLSNDLTMYGGSGYYLRLNGGTGAVGYDSGNNQILSYTTSDTTMWMGSNKSQITPVVKGGITEIISQDQIQNDYVSAASVQGTIITKAVSGGAVTVGQLIILNSSNQWVPADADITTTSTRLLGVALTTVGGANSQIAVLLDGIYNTSIYHDQIASPPTPGLALYISTNPGYVTQTAPSGTGDVVRLIGHNLYAVTGRSAVAVIRFKPDNTWIQL